MADTVPSVRLPMQSLLPDQAGRPAKAGIRKTDPVAFRALIAQIVTSLTGQWTLKEFAARLEAATGRSWDERQLRRWQDGTDRPQFDALWAIEELRVPIVLQFAALAGTAVEVTTQITVRRRA